MLGSAHALENVSSTPTGPEISTVTTAPEVSTPTNTNQTGADIKPVRFLVGLGLTFGGDTMATAVVEDITAGGLLLFYAGAEYRLNDNASIQGTIGYHADRARPPSFALYWPPKKTTGGYHVENEEGLFSRIPIEVMAYYHLNDTFRVGGGLRFVNSARLKLHGTSGSFNDTFASTTGLVIEGELLVPLPVSTFGITTIGIKLRSVSGEKYQSNNFPAVLFKGDHIGILANLYF